MWGWAFKLLNLDLPVTPELKTKVPDHLSCRVSCLGTWPEMQEVESFIELTSPLTVVGEAFQSVNRDPKGSGEKDLCRKLV